MKTYLLPSKAAVLLFCIFAIHPLTAAGTKPPAKPEQPEMSWIQAIVLGLVEGLTEYLPVSSTGHLTLAGKIMGISDSNKNGIIDKKKKEAADAYAICIQFGAIISVLLLYRKKFAAMAAGLTGKNPAGLKLAINTIAAFMPAAIIGLLFEDYIKRYLFGMWPVAFAWFAGGVVVVLMAKRIAPGSEKGQGLDTLTLKGAFTIGLIQCIAMWPGVSRSLATILGGIGAGLSVGAAVEFSFVLGLVTLSAATLYDGLKYGDQIIATFGIVNPIIGLLVAGVSALAAIKWMVKYLAGHSLAVFGWYRIALAIIVAVITIITGIL
jgi:undecaprenyl-diphosphatase